MASLVTKLFDDPIAAWHIRDLEFWGLRPRWRSWKTYHLEEFNVHEVIWEHDDDDVLVDASGLGEAGLIFSDHNTGMFKACYSKNLGFPDRMVEEWALKIANCDEEPLKLLLLAMTPRLRSVKIPTFMLSEEYALCFRPP